MSKKSEKKTERNFRMRRKVWPEVEDYMVWGQPKPKGYYLIPRTMPYFFKIMDDCSKNKPLSSTFFALWCRQWDESGFFKIANPITMANESGFYGQRAVSTWRTRMRLLEKLGFIKTSRYGAEEHGYVVILNPYKVVKNLYESKIYTNDGWYFALCERADEIGVEDLDEDEKK